MITDPAQYMAIALFVSFVLLIFTGYPVAWIMGGLAVIFTAISVYSDTYLDTFFGVDWGYTSIVVARIYAVMNNWVLVALPMFIFMGIMMDKSGVAEDLMQDLAKLFGRVRGGIAISVVLIGVLLAASTGIIGASVVLLAILGVPMMLKNEYDASLACGVVCATGTLGILIPPSIMLVLMADQIRVSVGDLFMGAMLPGLLLGAMYAIFISHLCLAETKCCPCTSRRRGGLVLSAAAGVEVHNPAHAPYPGCSWKHFLWHCYTHRSVRCRGAWRNTAGAFAWQAHTGGFSRCTAWHNENHVVHIRPVCGRNSLCPGVARIRRRSVD